ncbi:MAG: phosphatidylserine/phosphatidylglycerophosphate/cardiolipin synthase family protein [Chloroflexota bacterium]|nr:phosphatidylserine/phosphatidylglycerophosphate/cardiolipin synthase family protein [Chloroflexota bacterium]
MADQIGARFIYEGGQTAAEIAGMMANFIEEARESVHLAAYDVRLDGDAEEIIRQAIRNRLKAGVDVRLIYDASQQKPQSPGQFNQIGGDFAEETDHHRVEELGLPPERIRSIHGEGLMHQKFIIRDAQAVWTGTMNWTNDSMNRMENTIVTADSPHLAGYFVRDFESLWEVQRTDETGAFRTEPVRLRYRGTPAEIDVDFSPGQGEHINEWVAHRVERARRRIIFCSMLINSSKLLGALMEVLDRGELELWGVYDRTQMDGVVEQWADQPHVQWKVDAVHRLLREAELVGKRSEPYRPGHSHNFMHNKLLIVDDMVITGSYNLSHAAQRNAENMLAIDNPALAADAIEYVQFLRNRFLTGN